MRMPNGVVRITNKFLIRRYLFAMQCADLSNKWLGKIGTKEDGWNIEVHTNAIAICNTSCTGANTRNEFRFGNCRDYHHVDDITTLVILNPNDNQTWQYLFKDAMTRDWAETQLGDERDAEPNDQPDETDITSAEALLNLWEGAIQQ